MADFNFKARLVRTAAIFLLLNTAESASASVMSRQMLETRSMEAVEALAKAGGYSGCRMRQSSMAAGLYFIECSLKEKTAIWAGWTSDGETTHIAALNAEAQALTPPLGAGVPPENDPNFLNVGRLPAKMQAAAKLVK